MKVFILISVFFFSLLSFSQNKSEWDKLQDSAHNIGYCLYNVNQQFCNQHIATQNRLINERPEDEPEVTYFVMKEEWAKERVTDWAERATNREDSSQLKVNNLVLFFDINQYSVNEVSFKDIGAYSSFFVVNLKDDLKFKINKKYKNLAMNCSISHNEKPNILYNNLWREFMSGRLGLVENKVEFGISSVSKIRKKFRVFKRCFYRFKKQNHEL